MKCCSNKYFINHFFKINFTVIVVVNSIYANAQQTKIDSLRFVINSTKADTLKIFLYEDLGQAYRDEKKMDSSVLSYRHALEINTKTNYSLQRECWDMGTIDYLLYEMGNYTESLNYVSKEILLTEKINDTFHLGFVHLLFGHNYKELGEYRQSLNHYFKAKQIFKFYYKSRNIPEDNIFTILCISEVYLKMNRLDSALLYTKQGYKLAIAASSGGNTILAERLLGAIYFEKGNNETALHYYRQYIPDFIKYKANNRDLGFVLNNMAKIFEKAGQKDSAIFYAKKALDNAKEYHDQQNIYNAANVLSELYAKKDEYKKSANQKDNSNNTNTAGDKTERGKIDSLKKEFAMAKNDSAKVEVLIELGNQYRNASKPDSFIVCFQQALEIVQKNKYPIVKELEILGGLQFLTMQTSNYSMSMQYSNRALILGEQTKNNVSIAFTLANIANNYSGMGDFRKALDYLFRSKKVFETFESGHWAIQNIAETYLKMHLPDSALYYNKIAYHIADTGHNQQYMIDFAIRVFAAIYEEKGENELALKYYRQFITDFYKYNLSNREVDRAYLGIAKIYLKKNKTDSSIFYAKKALATAQTYNDEEHILNAADLLYSLHDSLNNESEAFRYFKIAEAAKDSMASIEKIRQIQTLTFNEQIREKEQADADAKAAVRTKLIIIIASIVGLIITFLIWNRIRQLRLKYKAILEQKELDKLKAKHEKQLLELEAKALRAQMNPHFIFNCMNSIKSLIQEGEEDKAITYLTTFSKLIRTIFNNSDKREISLFDEIETCKLYTQLESMRFENKFSYTFYVDENVDLKALSVPALILQPFIENAIWHGIMPKENGGSVNISIKNESECIYCMIADDGIGREMSKQNKFKSGDSTHNSKGVHLTQSRLDLDNLINERNASLEIIDKKDEHGNTAGTRVTLTFKKY